VDKKIKNADHALTELVKTTGSSLLQLNGIGPSGAARLLGDIADIGRFASTQAASPPGTAPRLWTPPAATSNATGSPSPATAASTPVLHIVAVVQLRHDTAGRAYFRRKPAAGKTAMEAMRCLKRRLSNVVYQRMIADTSRADPGGQTGATLTSSAVGSTPTADSSDKPLPGSAKHPTPPPTPTLTSTRTTIASPKPRRSRLTS
jgi:transposase